MDENQLNTEINSFDFAMEEASSVYQQTNNLLDIVNEAPERDLNNATMQVLYQAIESLQERSGLVYNTVSLESAQTPMQLKNLTMESLKEFASNVWEAIKKAIIRLYQKIKEFFTSGDRKVKDLKEKFKQSKDDLKEVKDTSVDIIEMTSVSPFLLHSTLYKNSNKNKTTDLKTMSGNLNKLLVKSEESNLITGVERIQSDINKLVLTIDASQYDPSIFDKLYSIMNNYVSSKKLSESMVNSLRQHRPLQTNEEFDSEYGNKRYKIQFSVDKQTPTESFGSLRTEQVISRVFKTQEDISLTITSINKNDLNALSIELDKCIDHLSKHVNISKDILKTMEAVQNTANEINAGIHRGVSNKHVLTMSLIVKALNAVIKIFNTIQSDFSQVVTKHFDLYIKLIDQLSNKPQTA